jgi:hypothetical protein
MTLRSYTFDNLKLLTIGVSFSGMLCMSLAGMISPVFLIFLAAVHAGIYLFWFDRQIIGQVPAVLMLFILFGAEVYRVAAFGRSEVVLAVRDLIIMAALIRLFMKITMREIYQIAGIAFAECLLSTIFTTSPLFLLGIGMMTVLLPMLLYALDDRLFTLREEHEGKGIRHWLGVSAGIVLAACIIFYLLPRPASSIIQHGLTGKARMNFSEKVDLRNPLVNENDNTVVMRVIWSSGRKPAGFYLSGARLEGAGPDGFIKDDSRGSMAPVSRSFTDRISIFPAALYSEHVFFPFRLYHVSPETFHRKGANIIWDGEPPLAYDVWVSRSAGRDTPCATEIPPQLESVGYLGKNIAGAGDAAARAARIASYLKKGYTYSLKKEKMPVGSSSIEWFVFSGKRGRCEHFAAASAIMLRGCGIPARVVTGFLVDEYNTNGDYYIVRASDAHAWVEYWDGFWRVLDATPPRKDGLFHRRPLQILDELRFRWYRWVIQFSLDDQIQFASKIFAPSPIIVRQVESYGYYVMYFILSGLALFGGLVLVRKKFLQPYEKVCHELKKKRIPVRENTSHKEHARLVEDTCPSLGPFFQEYLDRYLSWRFGAGDIDIRDETRKVVREIRKRARK